MEIKEFQNHCAEIVSRIDQEYGVKRDAQLALSQLIEEIGELAKEVNRKKLRSQNLKISDLENEFADVFLQLAKLADMHKIDLEKSIINKIKKLKERGYLK